MISHIFLMLVRLPGFLMKSRSSWLLAAVVVLFAFSSCKKQEPNIAKSMNSPTGGTQAALDSSANGTPVDITDNNHRLLLRPKVGTTQRYRIVTHSERSQDITDQLFNGPQGKKSTISTTEYYLRQTVRAVKPDSSIDMTFRLDSLKMKIAQDTSKIAYNSNKPADRKDLKFTEYNVIMSQDFGAIISKFGEILEIYGLQSMVTQIMKDLPDSMRSDRYKEMTNRQLQILLNQYVSIVLTHFPDKPLAKDSTWSLHIETNLPVSEVVQFPVSVTSKETLKGFQEMGGTMLAVLDATSSQTPTKTSFEQGEAKASLQNFISTATATTHIEDASGVLVKRAAHTKQSYQFVLESKQQAGKVAKSIMLSTEDTSVDLLQ
jgi:hypothetical protein